MSTTVTYKGSTLTTVNNQTRTLKTAGKYMEDDVQLTDTTTGGGGSGASKKQINFIDYDGTVLHSYTKSEWNNVSALPSNPSRTGLTAQGWNWTKAGIDAQLTAMPDDDIWVGQMYITDDGKTRIYIHLEEGRLHPYLGICPKGTMVVNWGDNSATSTLTGTSLTTATYADHVYASEGDYMITLTVSSGSFAFYGVSNTSHILKKDTTTTANIHKVYANAVQKVELGEGASIGNYAFNSCYSLASITIPDGVTSIGTNAFTYCYSLASITIPDGVTSIGNYAFNSCYSLASITIPDGVTSIGASAFNSCYSLANITIPDGVTSIGTNAFTNCYGIAEYHFLPTTPPTLASTNAFTNIQSDCIIYVPSTSLTDYQTATNWSTYASYMQGE